MDFNKPFDNVQNWLGRGRLRAEVEVFFGLEMCDQWSSTSLSARVYIVFSSKLSKKMFGDDMKIRGVVDSEGACSTVQQEMDQ